MPVLNTAKKRSNGMNIDLGEINYLAVIVGIIISMAGGALWFSPILFAKAWMSENDFTEEQIKQAGSAYKGYVASIVAAIVSVLALALFVQAANATQAAEGLAIGLLAGIGFVATTQASNYTFEGRSIKIYLINNGYPVVVFAIVGIVLAVWR